VTNSAQRAYDALATHYDLFTSGHDYEAWTAALEGLLRRHGATRGALLDVACGTGNSFIPLRRRGWSVTGCDVSGAMLREAARKAPGVPLSVCDMRRLPRLGSFDVVWCLDDAVNYLLGADQLADALAGMRRNLRPGGLLLFDVNTLGTYRGFFASNSVVTAEDRVVVWEGRSSASFRPGGRAEAAVTAFVREEDGWRRRQAVHRQRHHPQGDVTAALERAGLQPLGIYGQGLDGLPGPGVDELRHTKAIYVARRGEEVSRSDPHRAPGASGRVRRVHPEGQLTATARGVA
jgi:SAM-dependent methyltransferase